MINTLSANICTHASRPVKFFGGISIATLARLEKLGVLKPIRINKHSPTAQVFYTGLNLRETLVVNHRRRFLKGRRSKAGSTPILLAVCKIVEPIVGLPWLVFV